MHNLVQVLIVTVPIEFHQKGISKDNSRFIDDDQTVFENP